MSPHYEPESERDRIAQIASWLPLWMQAFYILEAIHSLPAPVHREEGEGT